MKTRVVTLLTLILVTGVLRAANPCLETGPHYGAFSCLEQGTLNTAGFLSPTSMVVCVGETVITPSAYGTIFNPGKKTRQVTFVCPQNPNYTETNLVQYVASAVTYRDAGGNLMPTSFSTPGTYTYNATVDGLPVGGVCSSILGVNVGTLTVYVWGIGDSDYDGFCDCKEMKEGTDPFGPNIVTELWLGYWRFDDTNWIGEGGVAPLIKTNLQLNGGRNVNAVQGAPTNVVLLSYREIETNGWANINCRQGTIRFWFRPNWNSTNSGGTGPQTAGRLIELGNESTGTPAGWWTLLLNSNGTDIRFITHTNGAGRTNVSAAINWKSQDWHQLALTYSSSNTSLYLDGQPLNTNGLGVIHFPSPSIRSNGFRIGSDATGTKQAKGRFDDLETFNFPLSAQSIKNSYSNAIAQGTFTNDCGLRPITLHESSLVGWTVNTAKTITNGVGLGNFGWLAWDKHSADANTLAFTLTNANGFAFMRSESPADRVIGPGDWVSGNTGLSGSMRVRESLDWLILNKIAMTLPVWRATMDSGANLKYQVTNFVRVQLVSYDLHGNDNWLRFTNLGSVLCNNQINGPPLVNAGSNQTVVLPAQAVLKGVVTDDGLPAPPNLTFQWSKVSGPGTVIFGNAALTNTTASFSAPGVYTLRLTGSDGELSASDTVDIRVVQPPLISILYPAHGDIFAAPAHIRIRTEPTDVDGYITNVQFFSNSVSMGSVTNLPFYFTLTNLPAGTYTFGATAKDNDGLSATATPVTITVQNCSSASLVSITLATNQVVGGNPVTGTVTLNGPAMTGGQTITLSCANPAVIAPPSVFIPAGQTSTNFVVTTTGVSATNTTSIAAAYHNQSVSPASLKLLPSGAGGSGSFQCGPMDVAFLIDTTGSMGDAIEAVKTGVTNLISQIAQASGGDFRLGLVTFDGFYDRAPFNCACSCTINYGEFVCVKQAFTSNEAAFRAALSGVTKGDGGGTPEPSDEALNTVIHGLSARKDEFDQWVQYGDFNTPFRPEARKIIILVTDQTPGGFDDVFIEGVHDINSQNLAIEALHSNIVISAVQVFNDATAGAILENHAVITGGVFEQTSDGFGVTNAIREILSQCGGTVANMVFVRDDSAVNDYTAFATSDVQGLGSSLESATFDLRSVDGIITAATMERRGELRRNAGTRFDFEWGVRSASSSNLYSFGNLATNAHLLDAYHLYSSTWRLPSSFYTDITMGLDRIYPLKLADRISSLCGNTIELRDRPQSGWPVDKNILTFVSATAPEIPQGRARGMILTDTNAPLNGGWDIVFNGFVVASSGRNVGWSVETNHTTYGGYNIGVPPGALVYPGYQVRMATPAGPRSGFFSVVSSNVLNSAPVLLPLTMNFRTVTGSVPVVVTVRLDKPASGDGAFVAVSWDGASGGTLPTHVVVPAGQRERQFFFNTPAVGSSTTFTLKASYNGYRKSAIRVLSTGGAKPLAPTGLDAIAEVNQIRVQWNASAGALSYNVKRSLVPGGPYTLHHEGLTSTTFIDTFVQEGQSYCYVVTAVNDNGESPNSNEDCVQPLVPEIVARPLIQPASGTFYESVNVTMSIATAGAEIWYTVDGSAPQQGSSIQYTVPFALTSNAIIRARGFKMNATSSPVATANLIVLGSTLLSCNVTNVGALTIASGYSTNRGPGFYAGRYKFTGVVGRQVTIAMNSTNIDTYLYLVDPSGVMVAQNDDENGSNAGITHTLKNNGTYFIEATSFLARNIGDYTISLLCQDLAELNVLRNGVVLENNRLLDFGATNVGVNLTNVVSITNSGSAPLILSNLVITPPGRFTFAPATFAPIAPGAAVNVSIGFVASAPGQVAASFSFRSNDGDNGDGPEDPFVLNLTARANIAGTPPSVVLTSPVNGATFTAPASINITGAVTQGASPIAEVAFHRLTPSGSVPIGVDTSAPYGITWSGVTGGKYLIQAIVTDTAGRVGISGTVSNFVNTPPLAKADEVTVAINSANNPVIVLPNDTDADGHTLSVTGNSSAAHGTVVRSGNTFTYTPQSGYVGKDSFTYTVSDGNGGTAVGTVIIKIPPSTIPGMPVASITAPTDGTRITSPTNIVGTAQSTYLDYYELQIRPAGDESAPWVTFATGTTSVTSGTLGTLNPTMMLNGIYEIQLVVVDLVGQSQTSFPVTIALTDKLKIGHFTISFTDLQIPVSGLPIKITRTYDSRNTTMGDFGVGWTLDVSSVRLHKNMVIGENWQGSRSGLSYCLQDAGPHALAIVFPDGRVERFRPVAKVIGASGECGVSISSLIMVRVDFEALPGSSGTLSATSLNDLLIAPSGGSYEGLVTVNEDSGDLFDVFGPVYDPSGYIYTGRDGRRYEFNAEGRVTRMMDRAGNSLTFGPDGITHSSGKSVKFFRDNGLIRRIYDPNGLTTGGETDGPAALVYKYDERDNLVDVQRLTDRNASVYVRTSFIYTNADHPHYLSAIKDPRGAVGMRSDYDSEGRLIATTDVEGKTTTIIHDTAGNREIVVDRLGNTNIHVYDVRGNIVSKINPLGVVENYAYDDKNNQTNIVFGNLQTNSFQYNGTGFLTDAVVGNLVTNKFTYNDFGQITAGIDGRGFGSTNEYDASGNMTRSTKAFSTNVYTYTATGDQSSEVQLNGLIVTNRFDAYGRVTNVAVLKAGGQLLKSSWYEYDENGNQTKQTTWRTLPSGQKETNVTRFVYDAQDRLIHTIDPFGYTNSSVFNDLGLKEATIDKLGRITRYDYDVHGRVAQVTYPDQTYERNFYDAEGRLSAKLDRAFGTTTYIHDSVGRLTGVVHPDGTTNTTVFDALGRVKYTVDARGITNAFGYDSASRRVAATNALGVSGVQSAFAYVYDASGNMTNMVDSLGRSTTNVFDAERRLVEVRLANGTSAKSKYDAVGRVYETIDAAGIITRFGHDDSSQLVAVTNAFGTPDQVVTRFTYDEIGNRLTQVDAENRTTRYEYDALGRRTRRELPLGMFELTRYDPVGNLTNRTDFKNKTTRLVYNNMNRLVSKIPDPSLGQATIQFNYYPTGLRSNMVDSSGTTVYNYDVLGSLKQKITPQGTLQYSYDANGNLTNLASTAAGGASMRYTYDALNRVKTVTDSRSGVTTYDYDLVGNLERIRLPNGITNTYRYGLVYELKGLAISNSTGRLHSYDYLVDQNTRRTNTVESDGRTISYSFDSLYRLRQERIQNSPVSLNGTVDYLYDKVGNRTNRTASVALTSMLPNQTFQYDTNDRLTVDTYDNNGNTLQTAVNNPYAGIQGVDEYDFEDRLIRRTSGADSVVIVYNGNGHKVRETTTKAGQVTSISYLVDEANPTRYAQVLEQWVSVNGGAAQLDRVYNYGLDLISQVFPAGFLPNSERSRYYIHDGHGSVAFLSSETGLLTDGYRYDAFGHLLEAKVRNQGTGVFEPVSPANTQYQAPNSYRYAGEQFDDSLGLYYLRARLMNPLTGRMWTADTFEGSAREPMSLHRYLYAHADPVNRLDPSGHESLIGVSVGSSIAGSLSAMYNGIVTAVGDALQATIIGVAEGKSVNDIVIGFVLDQTGLSTVFMLCDLVKDLFGSGGYDAETAEMVGYQIWREEVLLTFAYAIDDEEEGDFTFAFEVELEPQPQCFVAGTLVQTDRGQIAIDELRPGDHVLAWDEQSGEIGTRPVVHRFAHLRDEIVVIQVGEESVKATVEHPFLTVEGAWKSAGELKAGDWLLDLNLQPQAVQSVDRVYGRCVVYNVEVEGAHTYFVGPSGILAHNASAAQLRKILGILDKPLLDAHHIVARFSSKADGARKLLGKVGIEDLDFAANGVALPRTMKAKKKLKLSAVPHHGGGVHSQKYNDALKERLETAYKAGRTKAQKKAKMIAVLEQVGEDLKVGIMPYD